MLVAPWMVGVLIGLSAMAVVLLFVGIVTLRSGTQMRSRISDFLETGQGAPISSLDLELSQSFFDRMIAPGLRGALSVMARFWPQRQVEAMQLRLQMAGQPGGLTVSDFIGLKGWALLIVGVGVGAILLLSGAPFSGANLALWVLLSAIAFILPDTWLSRRIAARQDEVRRTLPDMLDMLVVAIEAGLSFENAVLEITSKSQGALALELLQVQRDVGVGRARREALNDMGRRTGVPDVIQFVSAINQAEELGISISRVLLTQAEEMRIKRRQRAQELANKAPIKMLFPMVFLIFPALFAVLLGPGVPELLRAFNGL